MDFTVPERDRGAEPYAESRADCYRPSPFSADSSGLPSDGALRNLTQSTIVSVSTAPLFHTIQPGALVLCKTLKLGG